MNEITRRRFLATTGICAGALPMLEQWLAAATVSGTTDTYTPPLNGPVDRVVSLAGNWALQLDAEDAGLEQQWFLRSLPDRIQLPGSLDERGKGSLNEKRETGMLSRVRTHTGPAWFQREIEIPAGWASLRVLFAIERSKATRVWLDDRLVGSADSLSVEQCFDLGTHLPPGRHKLTVRVDNAHRPPVGDPHQLSEHTQTNWNGLLGRIELRARDALWIESSRVFPEVAARSVRVVIGVGRDPQQPSDIGGKLKLLARMWNCGEEKITNAPEITVAFGPQDRTVEANLPLGPDARTWDEFSPTLYRMRVDLTTEAGDKRVTDLRETDFGLREFGRKGSQFTINGRTIFLRGKHDACVFPLTGYAPMSVDEWLRVLRIAKSYGINHYRFHTWCPPEAAHAAADILGIYMQPELPNWNSLGELPKGIDGDVELRGEATQGTRHADYLRAEGRRILEAYGNHASFVMFALGNELGGSREAMAALVAGFRRFDPRPLYAQGSNNYIGAPTLAPGDDYWTTTFTGGHYSAGIFFPDMDHRRVRGSYPVHTTGHINNRPPATDFDYREAICDVPVPVIGHEIGQFQVFPDFREIKKYTGVLRARNFEVFRERLERAGMLDQAEQFLQASGALAVICYREDIEAALRTPGFGGFQLLDLQDFPGQGTALVGILDAFMDSKGLIEPEAWREFCSETVPLLRMAGYTWQQGDRFRATAELAHFGAGRIDGARMSWSVADGRGRIVKSGEFERVNVPQGSLIAFGSIEFDLKQFSAPEVYQLTIGLEGSPARNSYRFWVYPDEAAVSPPAGVVTRRGLDATALRVLAAGGRVLLLPHESALVRSVPGSFQPDFWCYPMFKKYHPPGTLGILCDPAHPALAEFPTRFHSDWQWWPIVRHGRCMVLDETPSDFRPLVQVIDNFERNHKLALAFEARVGDGRLLVCSGSLLEQPDRPECRQLLHSLQRYAASDRFQPKQSLPLETLKKIFHTS
jgi:hypothetical protein